MSSVNVSVKDPGFESEEAQARKRYMLQLFGFQAKHYDLHDDIMGMGIHRRWGKEMVLEILTYTRNMPQVKMLDLACGTGFVTFNTLRYMNNVDIDAFDITPEMVEVAKGRLKKNYPDRNVKFWVGDAEVPYGDAKYDVIGTCFAFRNFANKNLAASNIFKALKPGGLLVLQDMTKPEKQPFRGIYLFALKNLMPIMARIIGTERKSARYLANSVLAMPSNAEIMSILQNQGFINIKSRYQSGGMGTLTVAYKPEN